MALTKVGKEGITGVSNASDATAITIDSSEKVGIGTTSPAHNLEIVSTASGSVNDTLQIRNNATASGTGSRIRFINSTDENSDTNGASIASIRTGNDNDLAFETENAERMRIDASGNVGIGTSPSDLLHLKGGSGNNSTGAPIIRLQKQSGGAVDDGQTIGGISWFVNDDGVDSGASKERAKIIAESQNTSSGTRLEFWTGNSNAAIAEQMRILADGSVCIGGTTATAAVNLIGTGGSNVQIQNNIASGTGTIVSIGFINDNGLIGSIQCGGSSTSYETSSDYRLKENVDYTWDATTRLKQLKPARFNFITDDTNTLVDGFLAHEVSSIVPEAISGTKDAMAVETRYTADDVETQGDNPSKNVGDPKTYSSSKIDPQGIDQSKLVPLLVKTIQELEARLTAGGL